jgi:hypothetical protein
MLIFLLEIPTIDASWNPEVNPIMTQSTQIWHKNFGGRTPCYAECNEEEQSQIYLQESSSCIGVQGLRSKAGLRVKSE